MNKSLCGLLVVMSLTMCSLGYAGEKNFVISYTPEQFDFDPNFNCITDASSTIIYPGTLTVNSDPELKMIGGSVITGTVDTLKHYYFTARHKPSKKASVTVILSGEDISEKTGLHCDFGPGGKDPYIS